MHLGLCQVRRSGRLMCGGFAGLAGTQAGGSLSQLSEPLVFVAPILARARINLEQYGERVSKGSECWTPEFRDPETIGPAP